MNADHFKIKSCVLKKKKHVSDNEQKCKFLISLCKYAYMHREI